MKRILAFLLLVSALVLNTGCTKSENNNEGVSTDPKTPITTEGEHIHVFDVKDTSEKYLRSLATCKSKNRYYYSCVCGEIGTATFGDGEKKYHDYSVEKEGKEYLIAQADCKHGKTYALSCSLCGDKAPYGVFYVGDKTECKFTAKVPDGEYISTEATNTDPATYYYSCPVCGSKGESTFVYGEPLREYTEEEKAAHIPVSQTVTLYDSKNVVYGFTCNTSGMPLRPVLQITKDGVTTEYPASVSEGYSTDKEGNLVTFYVIKAEAKLEPNQTYSYRIYDKYIDAGSEWVSITACDPSSDSFTFVNITDSQTLGTVGGALLRAVLEKALDGADFILHTGDWVEWSAYESEWTAMLDTNREYFAAIPSMTISGNHETTYQNGKNEIYKHFNYLIPDQASTERGFFFSFEYGNVKFIMLNTNDLSSYKLKDEQYYWLLNELKNNDCGWTVVAMHNPLYSSGAYGSVSPKNQTTLVLRNQLERLFAEHKVDLVIQAHDHVVQKTHALGVGGIAAAENFITEDGIDYTVDPNGVIYMMSGASGSQQREVCENNKEIYDYARQVTTPSWSEITVEGNKLTVIMKCVSGGREITVKKWGIIKNNAE